VFDCGEFDAALSELSSGCFGVALPSGGVSDLRPVDLFCGPFEQPLGG